MTCTKNIISDRVKIAKALNDMPNVQLSYDGDMDETFDADVLRSKYVDFKFTGFDVDEFCDFDIEFAIRIADHGQHKCPPNGAAEVLFSTHNMSADDIIKQMEKLSSQSAKIAELFEENGGFIHEAIEELA
jgi:hypothetical protein